MAKFFKDPDGKLIAALGNDVATPAGCTELTANTEDAAHEKHVPVVETERDGHVIRARVGSVEHPSLPEHYIEWIALEAEGRLEVHYLEPGMKPATFFAGGSKTGTVYAYCNLHGLWSATFKERAPARGIIAGICTCERRLHHAAGAFTTISMVYDGKG